MPVALDDDGAPDGFQRLAGTSFAAPIVSGVAAWLMAARPNLTGAQVADILRYSATDVDKAGWDSNTGYGVVNLAGALTREDPPVDTTEVNDDIEWIDGTRFSRADTPVFKAGNSRKVYGGYVDAWKDPADVYRIEVAKGRKVTVKLTHQQPLGPGPRPLRRQGEDHLQQEGPPRRVVPRHRQDRERDRPQPRAQEDDRLHRRLRAGLPGGAARRAVRPDDPALTSATRPSPASAPRATATPAQGPRGPLNPTRVDSVAQRRKAMADVRNTW